MGMALKETYPAEWKRFREELIKTAADPEIDSTKMRSYSFNYMRSFMLTKTEALVSAPDLEMSRMFVSDGAFLRQLKADNVSICATHAMVGLGANVQVSPAALRLMQDSVVFRMRAARAGEVTPVQRPEVSELDFIALETAMIASGASEENAEAFFNGTIQAKSESAQCSTGINMYDALEMIPVDQAGRIYALVQKNSRGAANY
jgi:hypothetical protein